jgi:hypothetical protein
MGDQAELIGQPSRWHTARGRWPSVATMAIPNLTDDNLSGLACHIRGITALAPCPEWHGLALSG